jgi:hypothetical protein
MANAEKPSFDSFDVREKLESILKKGKGGVVNIGDRSVIVEFENDVVLEEFLERIRNHYENNIFDKNTIDVIEGVKKIEELTDREWKDPVALDERDLKTILQDKLMECAGSTFCPIGPEAKFTDIREEARKMEHLENLISAASSARHSGTLMFYAHEFSKTRARLWEDWSKELMRRLDKSD